MDDARSVIAGQVRRAFIGAFGAASFEVWRGKDGLATHTADEVGQAVADSLELLLTQPAVADVIRGLHAAGALGAEPPDPGPPA